MIQRPYCIMIIRCNISIARHARFVSLKHLVRPVPLTKSLFQEAATLGDVSKTYKSSIEEKSTKTYSNPWRFYTFCDVQAGRRFTSKYLYNEWGRSRHQITFFTYLRQESTWHWSTEIRIAARTGTETPMDQWQKWQYLNYWMTKQHLKNSKWRSNNKRRLDGNNCSWERWRADGDIAGRTKDIGDRA